MKVILLIVYVSSYRGGMTSQAIEFNSVEQCEVAKKDVKDHPWLMVDVSAKCIKIN